MVTVRFMPKQKPGRSVQEVETDPELMSAVTKRFGRIVLDLAANEDNKQADEFYSPEMNSLKQKWGHVKPYGNRWLNPPFGTIAPWARKAAKTRGNLQFSNLLLLLVPASVGTNWWLDSVHDQALVLFLSPRLQFVGHSQPYIKDCALVVYGETPGYDCWRWRP